MTRRTLAIVLLAGCGPATSFDGEVEEPRATALALEGTRNEAFREASARHGVPVEILMVLAQHQGRFELPAATEHDLDLDPLEPATSEESGDDVDPGAEVDAAPVEEAEPPQGDEEIEPAFALEPDPTDADVVGTLDEDTDATDPEAVFDPQGDVDAAAAGDPHGDVELYGLMHLDPSQVEEAARLSGLSEETIRTDTAAGIEAAAALLADEARAQGVNPAARDVADWAGVLARFAGPVEADAPEIDAIVTKELESLYVEGFDVTTQDGERLVLVGPGLPEGEFAESQQALRAGQYPNVQWVAASSSNYGSRHGGRVRYVVIHDIEGTMPGAIAVFRNPRRQASAHYVIRSRDGHIVQMVREGNNAWHCGHGYFNTNSIGIEHEGFASRPRGGGYYTERLYRSSAALVCAIAKRYDIPVDRRHIFGHGNVPANQSSRTLCNDNAANRGWCGGASHHYDPGKYWDWNTYMRLVRRCVSSGEPPSSRPPPRPAPAPAPSRTTVKGLVYRGSDSDRRIPSASVRLGTKTVRANSEGYYEIPGVSTGNHTITARASGYQARSITRRVSGRETWGSVGLSPAPAAGNAELKGIVYRGRPENRVANATIILSNGRRTKTNSHGVYRFQNLSPGTYSIRATKSGLGTASTRRSLPNNTLTWGSVKL